MKKAFTLVEVLAVIVLLGILLTIIIPNVNSSIKSSREKTLKVQMQEIYSAAESYFLDHELSITEPTYVTINQLKSSGLLDNKEIKNPVTNKVINGCVKATYNVNYKQYDYDYVETCN